MNEQTTFDTVLRHLVRQGKQAVMPSGVVVCAYRGADGTSCAVGCLIPDDLYDPKMERKSYSTLAAEFPAVSALLEKDCRFELLVQLQGLHDNAASFYATKSSVTPTFFAMARVIAATFELNTNVLYELEKAYVTDSA